MGAGGFTYHLLSRRYRDRQWRPFRTHVAAWLRDWKPGATHLIIFGSSAGYTLTSESLQRYDRISIVEPDPIARFLFRRRFPRAGAVTLHAAHLLRNLEVREWREFAQAQVGSAFLFSNVIGQMVHIKSRTGETVDQRVARLFAILNEDIKHPWASYHDLMSTRTAPHSLLPFTMIKNKDSLASVAEQKFRGKSAKLIDHGTLEATYKVDDSIPCAWWELEPLRYHLIGWLQR